MTDLIVSNAYKHDPMQITDLMGTIFNRELKNETNPFNPSRD